MLKKVNAKRNCLSHFVNKYWCRPLADYWWRPLALTKVNAKSELFVTFRDKILVSSSSGLLVATSCVKQSKRQKLIIKLHFSNVPLCINLE